MQIMIFAIIGGVIGFIVGGCGGYFAYDKKSGLETGLNRTSYAIFTAIFVMVMGICAGSSIDVYCVTKETLQLQEQILQLQMFIK